MPNFLICLDASIVIQALVNQGNRAVQQQWNEWLDDGQQFVSPNLQRYEITNALHRYQHNKQLDIDVVEEALIIFQSLPITHHSEQRDHQRAMELARQFNRPAAYDAHYLALAERLGIDFWTADRRLANAVRHALPWVHLVSDNSA